MLHKHVDIFTAKPKRDVNQKTFLTNTEIEVNKCISTDFLFDVKK